MQLLFFSSKNDEAKIRLEKAIVQAVAGRTIEFFSTLDALRERFRFIIEPDSIAVLSAANREELLEMQLFRELLPEIYIILVIPDWKESTVKLARLLLPRFLSRKTDDFKDLSKVIKKMVSSTLKP